MQRISNLDKFDSLENFPIFSRQEYLSSISNDFGWVKNEKFCIPFTCKKVLIFQWVTFHSSPISFDGSNPSLQDEQEFMDNLISWSKESGFDFISQSPTYVFFKVPPKHSLSVPFGSFIIDLSLDEEELFKRLHSKHRNVIRKAEKDGVIISFDRSNKEKCHEVINKRLQDQKIDFLSLSELNDLEKKLGDQLLYVLAEKSGIPQGAAIIPWSKEGAYYLYGGSPDRPHTGAMNLLHWQTMLHFKALGVKKYDFVGARPKAEKGSKIYNIQRFKLRFGGPLIEGHLWKFDINPIKKKLFNLLIKLKSGSFPSDIIDNERKKDSSDV